MVNRILLVEDDETIGEVLDCGPAQPRPRRRLGARPGAAALARAAGGRRRPRRCSTSGLPDLDGVEVCRRLRRAPARLRAGHAHRAARRDGRRGRAGGRRGRLPDQAVPAGRAARPGARPPAPRADAGRARPARCRRSAPDRRHAGGAGPGRRARGRACGPRSSTCWPGWPPTPARRSAGRRSWPTSGTRTGSAPPRPSTSTSPRSGGRSWRRPGDRAELAGDRHDPGPRVPA